MGNVIHAEDRFKSPDDRDQIKTIDELYKAFFVDPYKMAHELVERENKKGKDNVPTS